MFDDDVKSKTCKYWPFMFWGHNKNNRKIHNNKKIYNVTFPRLAIISSTRLSYLSMWTMDRYWLIQLLYILQSDGKKAVGKHNTNLASCYTTVIMIYGWMYKQLLLWHIGEISLRILFKHTHTHTYIYLKYWYNICLFRFEFNWIEPKPECNTCKLRYVPRRLWCL